METRGPQSSVNAFNYWVCNSPDDEKWSLLPDLEPKDIQAARQTKFHFTGDIERKIITNPFFFKREKHLLRAQIARISLSTHLVPAKTYKQTEESPDIEENIPEEGDIQIPSTAEMAKAENWVHYTKNILLCNRTVHTEVEALDDQDPEELMKRKVAADPYEPRLKPITHDAKAKGGASAWSIRAVGDSTSYVAANPIQPHQNYGVVVVRSNTWPGATTFFTQGRWTQIYVGDGIKYESKTYYPVQPPKLQSDPVEK